MNNILNKDSQNETLEEHNIASELSKSSLWSRIFKNEENQVYSDIIIKGFVWVIMFIVSLIALIIIFKDGYTSNKEVVVLSAKDDNSYASKNIANSNNDFTFGNPSDNNQTNINNSDNNVATNKLATKQPNSGQVATNTLNAPVDNSSKTPSNTITKDSDSNLPNKTDFKGSLEQNQNTVGDLIRDSAGNSKNSSSLALNQASKANPTKSTVVKTSAIVGKAWLVTVYSGSSEAIAKSKWLEIEKQNPSLFMGKKPYFIKTNIPNKGIFYRVSLGDSKTNKDLPLFATAKEATAFCSYLKSNNISCFTTVVSKSSLSSLVNR